MNITPEILRAIADTLGPTKDPAVEHFICVSAGDFGCRDEVQDLLREGGLLDLTGCLGFSDADGSTGLYYDNNAMSIRFMYLEFLALYLEDTQ